MKTIQEIKTDIDVLVRKQGNQGALKLGDVLDDVVDIVSNVNNTLDRFKARITNVQAFQNVVPSSATEIVFAFFGEVDLTGYTKTGSIGAGIDVYKNGTKYAVVSAKIICAPANSAYFFNNYLSLTKLDFSNFDTANVISFASMFEGCIALTTLNLSSFNTAKVRGFNYMFKSCEALTSVNISNFDTSNATSFDSMFRSCIALTSLDFNALSKVVETIEDYDVTCRVQYKPGPSHNNNPNISIRPESKPRQYVTLPVHSVKDLPAPDPDAAMPDGLSRLGRIYKERS